MDSHQFSSQISDVCPHMLSAAASILHVLCSAVSYYLVDFVDFTTLNSNLNGLIVPLWNIFPFM